MKAIFFEQHGGPEVLKFGDLQAPKPRPGEALVKVRAVALNHLDIWVRRGWQGLQLELPHIGGSDICGEIAELNGTSALPVGTRVIANPGILTLEDEYTRRGLDSLSPGYKIIGEQIPGGFAEYVSIPIANLYAAPDGWSDAECAAPLLVGVTAWRMLFDRGEVGPGSTVLIVGAGGGVNSISILFARAAGAQVIALSSSDAKCEKAAALGAAHTINYREVGAWHTEVLKLTRGRGVDVVIDNVGAATISKSLRAVARGGRIVTVGNTSGFDLNFDNRLLFTKQVSIHGSTMGSRQDFIDMLQFMSRNQIRPIIDRIEPLSSGIEMLQLMEQGGQFGKIVLQP